jgi:hypothetical protein
VDIGWLGQEWDFRDELVAIRSMGPCSIACHSSLLLLLFYTLQVILSSKIALLPERPLLLLLGRCTCFGVLVISFSPCGVSFFLPRRRRFIFIFLPAVLPLGIYGMGGGFDMREIDHDSSLITFPQPQMNELYTRQKEAKYQPTPRTPAAATQPSPSSLPTYKSRSSFPPSPSTSHSRAHS